MIYILFGRETAESKSQRAVGDLVLEADGHQNMRGIKRAGRAGRAGRCAYAHVVEQQNKALALDGCDGKAAVAGQTVCGVAGENGLGNLEDALDKAVRQSAYTCALFLHLDSLEACCLAEAYDARNILGAAAAVLLLAAAGDKGVGADACTDINSAYAIGAVDLMA